MEESFNVQAVYDLLYKPWTAVHTFDHVEFPGVVPRTFIGPIIIATIVRIPMTMLRLSSFATLHVVRGVLATFVAASIIAMCSAIIYTFSSPLITFFFMTFTVSQFHIPFYASRLLPNVFALILSNFALADILRSSTPSSLSSSQGYRGIAILSIAVALFRSELVLLLLPTLVGLCATRVVCFVRACGTALIAAVCTAIASILVDSYFWQRVAYPELEVFYFNAVRGGSSAWGVSPAHWYFTNALPRALGGTLVLALVGAVRFRSRLATTIYPVIFFITVYSTLPHKELRFIFYALPMLNVAAAAASAASYKDLVQSIRSFRGKKDAAPSTRRKALRRAIIATALVFSTVGSIAGSAAQTAVSVWASRHNYPSAHALRRMHVREEAIYRTSSLCETSSQAAAVHIDVDSAINGISQFVYREPNASGCPQWSYSKDEHVMNNSWPQFTHLITERKHVDGFCVVDIQPIFAGVNWKSMRLKMISRTFVHRNLNVSTIGCISDT